MTYLFDMVDVKVDSCCSALSEIVELMKIYANECPEDGGKKLEIYQQYLTFFEGLKANKDYDEFRKLIKKKEQKRMWILIGIDTLLIFTR